jgi:hypothetical protein
VAPFFRELIEEEKMYGYFMQRNAVVQIANCSMTTLEDILGKRLLAVL